jgi:CrcB protein
MRAFFLVGLGSLVGGMARYGVGLLLPPSLSRWPLATWAVNVAGCFLIGALSALLARQGQQAAWLRPFLLTGFCGGFTTFSTFLNDQFLLLRGHQLWWAVGYLVASLVGGMVALWGGYQWGR